METLGQYLKREREFRQISQQDVARYTKYHISKIRALEADEHETLPAPPYVKGMLRSIAKYLGLDVTEVLLRYQDTLQERETAQPAKPFGLLKLPFYKRKHFVMVVTTTIFFILAIVVFVLFRETQKLSPIGEIAPSPETPKEAVISGSVQDGHKLWIEAPGNVWIKMQIDDAEPVPLHLRAGQSVEFTAHRTIRFFVSDSENLRLVFNGKAVENKFTGPQTFAFPQ